MNIYKLILLFTLILNYYFVVRSIPKNKYICYIIICILASMLVNLQIFFETPDSEGYKNIYDNYINSKEINFNIFEKDYLWLTLNKLFNYFFNSLFTIFFISSIAFLIKCFIIYKITDYPFHALLAYLVIFFQIHELTQHRISVASMFYLLSLYFLSNSSKVKSLIYNFLSFLCHSSLYFNLLVYFYKIFSINHLKLIIFISFILIIFTIFPNQSFFIFLVNYLGIFDIYVPRMFEQYLTNNYNVVNTYGDYYPLIYIPLTLFIVLFKPYSYFSSNVIKLTYFSISIGYVLLWFFSDFYVVGGRFFEFYLVPLVLLFGFISDDFFQKFFYHLIILLFIIRYFFLTNFFL